MADRITVYNMAVGHLAAGTIQDENEPSNEAENCRLFFDTARKVTQERFNFGFNRKRRDLSQIVGLPAMRSWYRYQRPSDCLVMRAVIREMDEDPFIMSRRPSYGNPVIPFEPEYHATYGRCILTPLPNAWGLYTFDQVNIEQWSEEAALSLSYMLASLAAKGITRNDNDVKRCLQLFSSSFDYATQTDANEGAYFEEEMSELERSRL